MADLSTGLVLMLRLLLAFSALLAVSACSTTRAPLIPQADVTASVEQDTAPLDPNIRPLTLELEEQTTANTKPKPKASAAASE